MTNLVNLKFKTVGVTKTKKFNQRMLYFSSRPLLNLYMKTDLYFLLSLSSKIGYETKIGLAITTQMLKSFVCSKYLLNSLFGERKS